MINYIFLTPSISVLGGAELYCLRRALYLKKKGFRIVFITGEKEGTSSLTEFNDYEIVNLEGLHSYYLGEKSKLFDNLIKRISELNLIGEIYIESHNVNCFLWGEVLSRHIQAKHIFYILAEFNSKKYKHYLSSLRNALYSERIIGITNQSLKICFPEEKNIDQIKNYVNVPFSKEEFNTYIKNEFLQILDNKVDYRILTISRLEKTYVEKLILSTIEISKLYQSKKIELIIIGDTKSGLEKIRLEKKYSSMDSFSIHFLGYVNPVSEIFFKRSNVFVGMGTAAINAISLATPTIIIDPRKNLSPGYFGDELFNFAFSESDQYIDLSELLVRGILNKSYLKDIGVKSEKVFQDEFDSKKSMEKLDQFYSKIITKENISLRITPSLKHRFFALVLKNSLFKIYKKLAKIFGREKFLKI